MVAGCILLAASPIQADDSSSENSVDSIEEVVVTGTRIARPDARAASPVVVYPRAELAEFADLSVEDFLNQLPQFVPGQGRSTTFGGDATATVDLRGLGPARTLTLLNGRRLGPAGSSTGVGSRSAVDVSVIPSALLERIEVVTGGASTVYGSDAIAGVVNFILRDDFDGVEVGSRFDIFGEGDGESVNGNLTAGTSFAKGRGRVMAYFDYLNRAPLRGSDRDFTSQLFAESRTTGELFVAGSPVIPEGIVFFPLLETDGTLGNAVFNQNGSVRMFSLDDFYNTAQNVTIQTEQTRFSTGTILDFELDSGTELYFEFMYSDVSTQLQFPITNIREPISFSIDSPFFDAPTRQQLRTTFDGDNDGIAEVFFAKRLTELGPRTVPRQSQNYRTVLGFQEDIASDWALDAYYSYDRSDAFFELSNGISLSRFRQGLLIDPLSGGCLDPTGGCVPVNVFGEGNLSQAAADFIRVDGIRNRLETRQHAAAFVATGLLQRGPVGDIGLSAGLEFRHNSSTYRPSPILEAGDLGGFTVSGAPLTADAEVYETFAELLVPLVAAKPLAERIELELGVRYSRYGSIGGVWSWKGGIQWLPNERIRFRGMVQRAVRAPAIEDLSTPASVNEMVLSGGIDFCLAANDPVGRGLADVCIAQGMDPSQLGVYGAPGSGTDSALLPFTSVARGNPSLDPERARTITLGADVALNVSNGLRLGVDYFSVDIDNAIDVAGDPFTLCALEQNPQSSVCGLISRRPDGFLSEVTIQPLNNSVARVRGIDAYLGYARAAPAWMGPPGTELSIDLRGTHYIEFSNAASALSPLIDCAGGFETACSGSVSAVFPEQLATATMRYDNGRFAGAIRWRWLSSVTNLAPVFAEAAGAPEPVLAIPAVDDQHYVDVSIQFETSKRSRLSVGVANVLENAPPLLGAESTQINTDPGRYDIYGRRFFIGFEMKLGG